MKYLLTLLACLLSPLSMAEECTLRDLVKLQDIARCAKQGDRTAQYLLGELYFQGKEVPKNYKTAFEWMSKAAGKGDKGSQGALGFYFYNGWGTKKDLVLAYTWWSLSIVNNEEPITRINLDELEKTLSVTDLNTAQRLASEWLTNHERQYQR